MINANTARSQENRDGGYWTGGGVFCSDNAIIKLENANVTANTADGFDGGIAGRFAGRIFMFNNPNSAFYGNSAAGVNLSGANSAKNADHIYAASNKVFMDTKLSDKVSINIIPLSLNGASSISGDVEVYMESADEVVKLYVTEVDKNGTPVENAEKFNYDVTVENANVTISKDAMDASVKITNKEKVSQTPQGGSDTSGSGGSTPQSYGDGSSSTSITLVKTGDNTPVMVMILLLAASALIIATVTVRKRKHK